MPKAYKRHHFLWLILQEHIDDYLTVSNGVLRVKWVFPASARDGEGFVSFAPFAAKIGKKKKKNKTKQKQIRDIIKVFTSNNGVVDMITHIHYHATHVQQKRA